MKFLQYLCLVVLSLSITPVFAQGAAGKWSATFQGRRGPMKMEFDFAVKGDKLTGTMNNSFMGATPISNGVINGDDLKFVIKFQGMNGNAMTIDYTGKVKGDEMTLTSKFENAPPGGPGGPRGRTFTAKRIKG